MLDKKKIEYLQEKNKAQKEEIADLKKQVVEYKAEIEKNKKLVEAAQKYQEAHEKELALLGEARQRYNQAVKIVAEEKVRYSKEFEDFMRTLKK